MDLRTTFRIDPSPYKIAHHQKVMFIGSCFATSIGSKMESGKMEVMINPSGTVYNPVSVSNTIDNITYSREFTIDDLYYYDGMWLSFFHYTDFSSDDSALALSKINNSLREASEFLSEASYLVITLGTARIYRLKNTGQIVSNCHKLPSGEFSHELLTTHEIVELWKAQLDRLSFLYPGLKIIFTISPVRHLKDGAHGNQVSKSTLFLAVEELLKHSSSPHYFPAYELLMDDLRDYRFYNEDMVHPSAAAIQYIWEAFSECYFDSNTLQIWNEASKITRALSHRFNSANKQGRRTFADKMLKQIAETEKKAPSLNFSAERSYFQELLKNQ